MTTGYTNFERLTETQIDAAAQTLWDFAWNSDPNDPDFMKNQWEAAGESAKRHYHEWARAVLLAAERSEPQHTWFRDFPRGDES